MTTNYTWRVRYRLALQEEFSVKEIMVLRACSMAKALKIRKDSLQYCIENNIILSSQKVPAEAVFAVTEHDIDYYYEKMLQEHRLTLLDSQEV